MPGADRPLRTPHGTLLIRKLFANRDSLERDSRARLVATYLFDLTNERLPTPMPARSPSPAVSDARVAADVMEVEQYEEEEARSKFFTSLF